MSAKQSKAQSEVFGNKDEKKEFPIEPKKEASKNNPNPADPLDFYIVKHYSTHPNSSDVDSASVNYQFYSPETFEEMTREDESTGKANLFHGFGGQKYVVLNDPTENKQVTK